MLSHFYISSGLCNVNPVDPHYLAGFKPDLSGEYVPRPLLIPAMEICTADVVDFLIRFGADLSSHYDGMLSLYVLKCYVAIKIGCCF